MQFVTSKYGIKGHGLNHLDQDYFLLVVSTHLKNISQNGNLPQLGVNIENIRNHHLDFISSWESQPKPSFETAPGWGVCIQGFRPSIPREWTHENYEIWKLFSYQKDMFFWCIEMKTWIFPS